MKTYKRKKTSSKCKENRINEMPDDIIRSILSRIPSTEEVVRTSILSKRWTSLWTLIPSIDIDCNRVPTKDFDKKIFKKFVFSVLQRHLHGTDSFRLCCSNHYSMCTLRKWIREALKRKARILDLKFCAKDDGEDIVLPRCLVTSDSLEVLRLFLFRRPLVFPKGVGFPTLKVLELNSVTLVDNYSVDKFLANLPVLEDLCLIDCVICELVDLRILIPNLKTLRIDNRNIDFFERLAGDDDDNEYGLEGVCNGLEISCPKLVSFEYAGHIAYYFFLKNLDSLKKAVLYPEDIGGEAYDLEHIGDNMCQLFAGVSHVESLSLSDHFIQVIAAAHDPNGNFPRSLPNLKTLEITTTMNANHMNVVMRILRVSSNLESLHLVIEEDAIELWEFDEFLTCHLKRVKFLYFNGEQHELDLARFLMEHGNELEEMVFCWSDKVKYHEKLVEIMNELSKFQKASLRVKLNHQLLNHHLLICDATY